MSRVPILYSKKNKAFNHLVKQQIQYDDYYVYNSKDSGLRYIGYVLFLLIGIFTLIPYQTHIIIPVITFLCTYLAIEFYMAPRLRVTEQGIAVWLFQKFSFVPVSKPVLLTAKLAVLRRLCTKLAISYQVMQLIGVFIEYHNIPSIYNFIPCFMIFLLYILTAARIKYHAKHLN